MVFLLTLLTALIVVSAWIFYKSRTTPISLYYCLGSADDQRRQGFVLGKYSSLADLVRTRVPALTSVSAGFSGIWWLPGGNLQTIYTTAGDFSRVDPVVYERKYIEVADGGLLTIDITPPVADHPIQKDEIVVLIAHGLTGGSHEHYVRASLKTLSAPKEAGGLGLRGVVLNFRGCNGSPVLTPKLYHAGSSHDVGPVVLWISKTFPGCRIFGLGFSLGANVLTKYVGEEGDSCQLSGLVSLANVWDFYKGSDYGEKGNLSNRYFYRFVLGGALQRLYGLHKDVFYKAKNPPIDLALLDELFRQSKITLPQFDNLITAPLYGFKDAMDYYYQVSSCNVLDNIKIPVLGINSLDDPIVGPKYLPYANALRNPWLFFATTQGGGHMGWFSQNPDGSLSRWYVKPVRQFLEALIECDLSPRPVPETIMDAGGKVWIVGRPDVSFRERDKQSLNLVTSGAGESHLFSGF